MTTPQICENCKDPFDAKRSTARYCSATCRKQAHRASLNDASAQEEIKQMKAHVDALAEQQREHRGTQRVKAPSGKEVTLPGPYTPTPESEARAKEIIMLRKRLAYLEHGPAR